MAIKGTNLVIWLGLGLVVVLALVTIINTSNAPESTEQTRKAQAQKDAQKKRITTAEVEGDTIVDTLKTVQAKNEASEEELKALRREIERTKEELRAVTVQTGTGKDTSRFDGLANSYDRVEQDLRMLRNALTQQTKRFETTAENGYEFSSEDLGFGEVGSNKRSRQSSGTQQGGVKRLEGYAVVPVISATATPSHDPASKISEALKRGQELLPRSDGLSTVAINQEENQVIPYRTIPARSTLFDAKAMTALIGRVPVEGSLKDPFPVKFIVGKDNVATNGIRIPNVDGIIFEGVASGNWNLACVSVQLTAATFTFADGTIRHLQPVDANSQVDGLDPFGSGNNTSSIGYITNTMGAPCIAGKRVTDAPKQMATVGLLGLAASYFDAKAEAEVTNQTDALGGSQSVVTGDPEKFAENEALRGTIDNATQFYMARNRDTFDAIVSQPGAEVILHITSDLLIDYESQARKISYGGQGASQNALTPL